MANNSIPSFPLGAVVRVTFSITSSSGSTAGVDPGSFTVGLKEPDGTTYAYAWGGGSTVLATTSAGGFVFTWPTAKEGVHRGGGVGTSANAGAEEFAFNVTQRPY